MNCSFTRLRDYSRELLALLRQARHDEGTSLDPLLQHREDLIADVVKALACGEQVAPELGHELLQYDRAIAAELVSWRDTVLAELQRIGRQRSAASVYLHRAGAPVVAAGALYVDHAG